MIDTNDLEGSSKERMETDLQFYDFAVFHLDNRSPLLPPLEHPELDRTALGLHRHFDGFDRRCDLCLHPPNPSSQIYSPIYSPLNFPP